MEQTSTMPRVQIAAEPGVPQILMTREFDAPPGRVFRAFVDPELLIRWLGPRRLRMEVDRHEVRDGGTWRYLHIEDEGTVHGFHGVFHGVPSVENGIVRTFEYEGAPGHVSMETATFEDRGGRTMLRINSVFQSVQARDAMLASGMEEGLNDSLDRLSELLARETR